MKQILCTAPSGCKIYIPINKIAGYTEMHTSCSDSYGKTYIRTGAEDGEMENGFYVKETIREIYMMLEIYKD